MKQTQYSPLGTGAMAVSLFAANEGYLDDVDVKKIVAFEQALQGYMKSSHKSLLDKIDETGDYSDDIKESLHQALKDFKANNTW
jgi:F-type H+-transporting ATPase subunit alpha